MTKTPPEEPRIVTRLPGEDGGSARREETHEILEMIDGALEEHAEWLRKWHRSVVCALPPDREVVSRHGPEISRFGNWYDLNSDRELLHQPVFRELWSSYTELREYGRKLVLKAVDGETLAARDYDVLVDKAASFVTTARRIRDAFQRAILDLDPLTGVHNRRSMMTELDRERARSIRTGKGLCICLCDIDHFKAVNDRHGHLIGDSVLLAVAGRLIANLRPYDSIYRFGGEEFLLAIAETDEAQAAGIAERLRQSICAKTVTVDDSASFAVTASFGLCMVDPAVALETTIQRADGALYRAKEEGRNRVVACWDGTAEKEADGA